MKKKNAETAVPESVKEKVKQRAMAAPKFEATTKQGELIGESIEGSFVDHISKMVKKQFEVTDADVEDGIGSNLKNYMNSEELKNFMWIFITAGYSDHYLSESVKHGNITRQEFDVLSSAMESMKLYSALRMERADKKTNERIQKKTYNAEVRLFDRFMIDKMRAATEDVLESVLLNRSEFEEYSDMLMRQHCRNCKLDQNECELNTILNDNLVPESGKQLDNCPFAYCDNDLEDNINVHVSALRNLKRDRVAIGAQIKHDGLSAEIMSELVALNKGIEALIRLKNGEV